MKMGIDIDEMSSDTAEAYRDGEVASRVCRLWGKKPVLAWVLGFVWYAVLLGGNWGVLCCVPRALC